MSVSRVQGAMRRTLRTAVRYHATPHSLATITQVGPPVIAETHDSNIELEEGENLVLPQHVLLYHKETGLQEGDNLTVVLLGEGVWHATAVFSDTDLG